jgi:hypothetical protein
MGFFTSMSGNSMKLVSYPVCLVAVPLILMVIATVNIVLNEVTSDPVGLSIFYGVCLIFLAMHSLRVLELNKLLNTGRLIRYSIRGREQIDFSLTEPLLLEMSYGRGNSFAKGGTLMLNSSGVKCSVLDSDICFGNERRVRATKEKILSWIN